MCGSHAGGFILILQVFSWYPWSKMYLRELVSIEEDALHRSAQVWDVFRNPLPFIERWCAGIKGLPRQEVLSHNEGSGEVCCRAGGCIGWLEWISWVLMRCIHGAGWRLWLPSHRMNLMVWSVGDWWHHMLWQCSSTWSCYWHIPMLLIWLLILDILKFSENAFVECYCFLLTWYFSRMLSGWDISWFIHFFVFNNNY